MEVKGKKESFQGPGEIEKMTFLLEEYENLKAKNMQLQRELEENNKFKEIGEAVAGISHDINNILTPIVGSVQLLKGLNIKDKNIIRQLNIIEMCALDGIHINNKVNKLTGRHSEPEELKTFSIDEIILDAIELTKDRGEREKLDGNGKISMVTFLRSKEKIRGNMTEIREVLINIIGNAIDAIPKSGKIEVSTETENKYVNIEIKDNGIGMSSNVMKKVFTPFFTTKGTNGSGLGLSISHKIIENHGGAIKVESRPNIGTWFKIQLPIHEENEMLYKKEAKIGFEGNILVIDDQDQIRTVVVDMIKSITSCKIKSCRPLDIDEELKRRKYDIILCDFSMPYKNGIEIAQIVKKMNKETYFCLMTGWTGMWNEQKTSNIDFILNKPIKIDNIKELINTYSATKHKK